MVGSILSYSSEVWDIMKQKMWRISTHKSEENVGCKKIKESSGCIGELGRWPLIVNRKVLIIQYWAKLIGKHGTLQHQIYMMLRQ
jgi:hypothetical protein